MTQRLAAAVLAAGLFSAGCAYYNGLYNANRLAKDAARARREGRGGEARSLWDQAAVKAESVAIRFPRSRYRDDAWLLQGRALLEADRCDAAVVPLAAAADSGTDRTTRDGATLLLGQCRVRLGESTSGRVVLEPLVTNADSSVARAARLWRARAALAQADYATALADLTGLPEHDVVVDRATAFIGLGDPAAAAHALLVAAPGAYDEQRWPVVLATLDSVSPGAASPLVDSLVLRGNLSAGQRARLLLADADRWERRGARAPADARLTAARMAAPDSVEGARAGARLLLEEIRASSDPGQLRDFMVRVTQAAERSSSAAAVLGPANRVLQAVNESAEAPPPARFLAIEAVRDSLRAEQLAAGLFRAFQRDHPDSPLAPKALLAAALLQPDSAAVSIRLAQSLYASSPYLADLPENADAFMATEETLRADRPAARDREPVARPRTPQPARGVTPLPVPGRRTPEP